MKPVTLLIDREKGVVKEPCGCIRIKEKYLHLCETDMRKVAESEPFLDASIFAVNTVDKLIEIWSEDPTLKACDCIAVPRQTLQHLQQVAKIGLEELRKETAIKK